MVRALGLHFAWTAALALIGIAAALGSTNRSAHPLFEPHRVTVDIDPGFDDPTVVGVAPSCGPRLLFRFFDLVRLRRGGLFEPRDPRRQPEDQRRDRVREGTGAVAQPAEEGGDGRIDRGRRHGRIPE